MALNLEPRVRQALIEVLYQALARGEAVTLPGFGVLRVSYESARVDRSGDGITIRPPRRSVVFDPDESSR